jgi:hypothetical protein
VTAQPQGPVTVLMEQQHPGTPVPAGEVYTAFLDTRTMIETYLEQAALTWFQRSGTKHVGHPYLGSYTEDVVELVYFENHDEWDNDIRSTAEIPIADLLPEYAAHRAILQSLAN